MNHLNIPVEEFTTPNPITADKNASLDELLQLMEVNGIRHIPIVTDKGVVGIISDRDLRVASGLNTKEKKLICAEDIMVTNPVTVNSNNTLDEVAFEMSKNKIGSVIVNDENDELLGIFTATDALNALIEVIRGIKND